MRQGLIAIAALTLGGCSGTWFDAPVQRAEAQDSPESYYRFLVTDSALARGLRQKPQVALQISPVRRSVPPQPGDWTTCVRVWEPGKREMFYAVFIQDRAIIDYRGGVAIDRCEAEQYIGLAAPIDPLLLKKCQEHDERSGPRPAACDSLPARKPSLR